MINAKTHLCSIIGNPVEHSMSPAMHNAAYKALGLNFAYVAFRVESKDLGEAIKGIRALGIRGVSVTVPHKVDAMQYLDEIDETAQKIGAINTIMNTKGHLKGYNTDWEGAMRAVEEGVEIKDKKVVLLGAGGAARAVAYGFARKGIKHLIILNRSPEKAKMLAQEVGCEWGRLEELTDRLVDADILFQSTTIGMYPHEDETIMPKEYLRPDLFLAEAVYNPFETRLIREAREVGCKVALGYRMLLWQGVTQFELFTGVKEVPVKVMEEAVLRHMQS